MRFPRNIEEVVSARLCVSCGACVSSTSGVPIPFSYDPRFGMKIPRASDQRRNTLAGGEITVCPGKGYPISRMSTALYGDASRQCLELGLFRAAFAAHSTDKETLRRAASGGVMTEIAAFMLEERLVEAVTVSKFEYGRDGPRAVSLLARSAEELRLAQGSKYCPTSTNLLHRTCREAGGRYLFIGTPCQVAALRLAAERDSSLNCVFPFTMANFCGGFRDYRDLDDLLERNGLAPSDVIQFRFRGGGQPGSMQAITRSNQEVCLPYPGYGAGSLVPKHRRCSLCVDATGVLADFSCGDGWIERFQIGDGVSWSIILARSAAAESIVRSMVECRRMEAVQDLTEQEIIYSQRFNIDSKINRQRARIEACRLLHRVVPEWDLALPPSRTSRWRELRTLLGKEKLNLKYHARYLLRLRRRVAPGGIT